MILGGACGGKSSAGDPDSGTNNNSNDNGNDNGNGNNNNQAPVCGNAVQESPEECDTDDLSGATCESLNLGSGLLACTATCTFDATGCSEQAECGNQVREYPETCDGTDVGTATCENLGYVGGVLQCNSDCEHDVSQCLTCGNDVIDGGDQCDGDDLGAATCGSLGLGTGSLACTEACTFDTTGCSTQPVCSDGVAQGAELCDGNDLRSQTCASLGHGTGDLACTSGCDWDFSGCEWCGNGTIDGSEECDGVDLASTECTDLGMDGGTLACASDCTWDLSGCQGCGNGVADGSEQCDGADLYGRSCTDFGLTNGILTCSSDCTWDLSTCVGCGNGVVESTELCDGADLTGMACTDMGFDAGILGCMGDCTFDTSGCTDCGASDHAPPVASNFIPAPETLGALGSTLISVDLYDACGINTSAISMRITIQPKNGGATVLSVTPVVTGSGTNVTATYQHTADYPPGAVITVLLSAADVNGNTLTETWRFTIRDRMWLWSGGSGSILQVNAIDEANPDTNYSTFTESYLVGGTSGSEMRMIIRFAPTVPTGPIFWARLDLGVCPPWPPTTPVVTSIECFRLNVESLANQATWNDRRTNPVNIAWGAPGANSIPADRLDTAASTMDPNLATGPYQYVSDDVLGLVEEWQGGAGFYGILCTVTVGQVPMCNAGTNAAPRIELEYGPPLP